MPKFEQMNVNQLKQLSNENGLSTVGKKAELVARLKELLGVDEAELPSDDMNSIQSQVDDLRRTMTEVVALMRNSRETHNAETNVEPNAEPNAESNAEPMHSIIHETVTPNSYERESNFQYTVNEMTELLPEFNPTDEKSLSAEQFIHVVQNFKTSFKWDDKPLLLAAGRCFKGVARLWLDSTRYRYKTWQELSNAIIDEYGSSLDEASISHKMRTAVRNDNEKITEYCYRMQALGMRFKLSDAAIVRYAREGLKHQDLQRSIAAMRITSTKELRNICETYFENSSVDRTTKFKSTEHGSHIKPSSKQQQQGQKDDDKKKLST